MLKKKITAAFKSNPSAQIYTLEALMALLLIIGVIIFTVQATSLTPLTSSTANAHIEAQLQILGQDMLNSLDYAEYGQDSPLKRDILNWDGAYYTWDSCEYSSVNGDVLTNSSTAEILKTVAAGKGIAHNVEVAWLREDLKDSHKYTYRWEKYIYNGEPSDNAVIITKRILLSDTDFPNMDPSSFRQNTGIRDADTGTDFYNVVDVKLTLWRM
ncbi:DUF7288 family protein [Methanolobus chelungpuianus]|uniref:Uncharacterized protein n=1 Tax=Methanolobus chelungpuianus TaxID=502115 RepID=A0AAE3H8E0_9EURY|nr:hypothetical protein [Methanolobus chelungpuianus]MCQ6961720.1 hypothetical protein [Methanolobus chelungpuianus]